MKLALLTMLSALACAQSVTASSFEVASIRQNTRYSWIRRPWNTSLPCAAGPHGAVCGNRFTEEVASLLDLIGDAYSVRPYQISRLPDWGDSAHDVYDIDARVTGGRTPTVGKARAMLQTLLADRFHLKLHHETKDLPVFALVPAKNGPKLKPAQEGCNAHSDDALAFQKWAGVTQMLSHFADRPVIDKTGFDAPYYCALDGQDPFTVFLELASAGDARGDRPQAAAPDDSNGPSVFTLLEEKWGLKLESQKAPLDVLVIDHVERPGDN